MRHGQPEWVRDGLNVVDPPLTELGHRQAAALAEAMTGEALDEVLVSPLLRARQTAAPVLAALGRSEDVDLWLEEIRDPKWHGTPAERAAEAYSELREPDAGRPVARARPVARTSASSWTASTSAPRSSCRSAACTAWTASCRCGTSPSPAGASP